jgi:hypothetical protein
VERNELVGQVVAQVQLVSTTVGVADLIVVDAEPVALDTGKRP